jgi:mono/diheme cytochrome c family protein
MRAEQAPLTRVLRGVSLMSLVVLCGACEWFSDFKRQPYVTTWESLRSDSLVVRGSPQGSVPVTGSFAPGLAISYSPLPATLDSFTPLPNPRPVTVQSLENGRRHFQLNCAVCHGDRALGDGPAVRYGMQAMNLTVPLTQNRSDGWIFGAIRNGVRIFMPSYNRIEEMDRWDIVNYVRALQGRTPGVAFEVGPVALPGVTGDRLPGASRLGPTRWVPHVMPDGATRGPAVPADTAARADTARTPGRAGGAP